MATSSLPLDIKELLTEHIESVAQLEVLFLFYSDPSKAWSCASLSRELRSNETSAAKQIALLSHVGFVINTSENYYIYSPKSEKLASDVQKLHQAFVQKQVAVIAYLYEKPKDKLKGFADAFKIKKD